MALLKVPSRGRTCGPAAQSGSPDRDPNRVEPRDRRCCQGGKPHGGTKIASDSFCGAGGLTRGRLDAGIEVVAGFDRDSQRQTTYERNNPPAKFVLSNIRDLCPAAMALPPPAVRHSELLLAACAPWQPCSAQRKQSIGSRDEAVLLGEFGRLVEAILPAYVVVENVPGIARVPGFSTFRRFCRMLDCNRYQGVTRVMDAKDFGVARNRRRRVPLAARYRLPSLPVPTHGSARQPYGTVRQSIARFPPIPVGGDAPETPTTWRRGCPLSIWSACDQRRTMAAAGARGPPASGCRAVPAAKRTYRCLRTHVPGPARSRPVGPLLRRLRRPLRPSGAGSRHLVARGGRPPVRSRSIPVLRHQHRFRGAGRQCCAREACRVLGRQILRMQREASRKAA